MLWFSLFIATVDPWDVGTKVLATLGLIASPLCLVLITRRGARADRTVVERTEVEKLYVTGTQDLIKHLQSELTNSTADRAKLRERNAMLVEELSISNKSMATYQSQYDRLLSVLRESGVNLPEDLKK